MSFQDIYDFESLVPTAIKPVLEAAGLKTWIITDSPLLQNIRPRVDIVYQHHGEEKPRRWSVLPDRTRRGSAFVGELSLHAISDCDAPGKQAHSIYRATVRAFLSGGSIESQVNEVQLPFHKLQWLEPGNERTGVNTDKNFQLTTFPFSVKISIQQNAWAQLTT